MNYDFIIQKLNEYIIYLKYKQSKLKEEYFNFFKWIIQFFVYKESKYDIYND